MTGATRAAAWLVGLIGLALVAVGIVYLVVECQALPGVLGPTPGDTAPRTGLGIACLVLGAAALTVTWLLRTRSARHPPRHG